MPAEELTIQLNEGGPNWFFLPGSEISGALTVKVQWAKKYDKVVVRLRGRADTYWEVTRSSGDGGSSTDQYSAQEEYIHEDLVVWRKTDTSEEFPAGTTVLPFQFTLPPSLPSSCASEPANLTYYVEGVLYPTLSDHRRIPQVQYTFDVNEFTPPNPEALRCPVAYRMIKRVRSLCLRSGAIEVTVTVPCTGLNVGDTLPVSVHVDNTSSRRISVEGKLGEALHYRGYKQGSSKLTQCYSHNVLQEHNEHVEPHAIQDISFSVTTTHTPVQLSNIIETRLVLYVLARIPWSSNNLRVNIPISVANVGPEQL